MAKMLVRLIGIVIAYIAIHAVKVESITNAAESAPQRDVQIVEKLRLTVIAWEVRGRIIPPQCFITVWDSYDNYEAFEDKFAIVDRDDFRANIGKYFGKEPRLLNSLIPTWAEDKEAAVLVSPIDECFKGKIRNGMISLNERKMDTVILNRMVTSKTCNLWYGTRCAVDKYRIVENIDADTCNKLAPKFPGNCIEAYLVTSYFDTGGSKGSEISHVIQGLFNVEGRGLMLVPLKAYKSENAAIGALDR